MLKIKLKKSIIENDTRNENLDVEENLKLKQREKKKM